MSENLIVEMRLMNSGKLRAFADVTFPSSLGEVTVHSFRVVQEDEKSAWVAFPSISYSKGGKTINKPIVEVPRRLRQLIVDSILGEFQRLSSGSSELPDRPQRG